VATFLCYGQHLMAACRLPPLVLIPPQAALKSALTVVDRLLDRERDNNGGKYPETIALVLWGTDNIKTYGESLAQVMMMVGIRPVPDALGRVNKLEVGRWCEVEVASGWGMNRVCGSRVAVCPRTKGP